MKNPFKQKTLFIVRGLPGSGKTSLVDFILMFLVHYAKEYNITFTSISTDDFWITENNEYVFNPLRLDEAHEDCARRVNEDMKAKIKYIFLHNTMSQSWESQPYFTLARQYGYDIFVIETQNPFTSIHGVPEKVIDNMISRWQNSVEFNRLR